MAHASPSADTEQAAASVSTGCYPYTADLQTLQHTRPPEVPCHVPQLASISSPLTTHLLQWKECLRFHPDQTFATLVLQGIEHGFNVGFDHTSSLHSASSNMQSARSHTEVVSQYVEGEVAVGRIFGPFPRNAIPGLHINRMGVIPKGHVPGRWHLITDLSYPEGASVNDGIDPQLCSLQYITVDEVAQSAMQLGRGTLFAKLDVKAAYRLVPVHPRDRRLLGFEWQGMHYVDGMLPFGLRSAPKLFTAVADALEWVLKQRGVSNVAHYLDDFITMGPPHTVVCQQNLDLIMASCAELGVPLATDKLEGPTHCLTFLGIEVDTQDGTLRLPADKLSRLQGALLQWTPRKACRRHQLESLIGTLQHACRVIRPGRAFLRRMIDLLRIPSATRGHHHIRLNRQFQADLQWWRTFARHWNRITALPVDSQPSFQVTSDASGQ